MYYHSRIIMKIGGVKMVEQQEEIKGSRYIRLTMGSY